MKENLKKVITKKVDTVISMLLNTANSSISLNLDWWNTSIKADESYSDKGYLELNLLKNYFKEIEGIFKSKGVNIQILKGSFIAIKDYFA